MSALAGALTGLVNVKICGLDAAYFHIDEARDRGSAGGPAGFDGSRWDAAGVTRSTRLDVAALSSTLRLQHNVIAQRQAMACGMTRDALTHWLRPGGPWQQLLPRTYLAVTGTPTVDQKEMAALLYAGPAACSRAGRRYGARA